jgi:GTP cyclohydrolase I
MEYICNPNYAGGVSRRIIVQSRPSTKVRPYLEDKLKPKGLGIWLKSDSTCQVQSLVLNPPTAP